MLSLCNSISRSIMFRIVNRHSYLRCLSISHTNFEGRCQHRKSNIQTKANLSQAIKVAHMYNPGEFPLSDKTVGQTLGEAVATWPEQTCIVSIHQNIRLTFSDLLRRVDAFAAGLKKLGMKKGDRLGIWGPNDLEWFITSLSASRVGLIVVAINPAYQQNELIYCLQKVGIKAIVSPDMFKVQNYPKMLLTAKEVYPTLEHIIIYSSNHITGTHRFADVEASATKAEVDAIAAEQAEISCNDGCNIQFTSGSTGKAKATLLSHRCIVNNSKEAIAQEKCAVTYGTPTMWVNLLKTQRWLQLPMDSLQAGFMAGAPASSELIKRIRNLLGFNDLMSLYGLTETAAVFQSIRGEDKYLSETTVGYLGDHVEAMVVDLNGLPVAFGKPGELWVRGYSNMLNYWNDEENTRKTLTQDGWLKTGDQFILHENGYGVIIGRLKDMLIRGGENIFPKEIEDFLMTHPKIIEAQVIGAYDEVYGDEICACIQLSDNAKMTQNEVIDYCKGKIAHFKIPRYVHFVDDYPKTTSGKIQKFRLKEQLENSGVIPTGQKNL
ncbi:acyl-CoA synthetase family member 2, mitochondrial isoform X2 [Camponotus floridanus]|uniref:acyl-CoA synthetase family member 2, mitochondrial isoform X2 n=1 Tax=Camponotus floridanus TaxID=104421 RepID=UPI000DC6AA5E|nr:acyl-CoA synthetase family member 2, mitochondrial isoform X2 [Camponotus floridanus]